MQMKPNPQTCLLYFFFFPPALQCFIAPTNKSVSWNMRKPDEEF